MQPEVGSVWGDPAKPDTWRMVRRVNFLGVVHYSSFAVGVAYPIDDWSTWTASSGAVDITEKLRSAEYLDEKIDW